MKNFLIKSGKTNLWKLSMVVFVFLLTFLAFYSWNTKISLAQENTPESLGTCQIIVVYADGSKGVTTLSTTTTTKTLCDKSVQETKKNKDYKDVSSQWTPNSKPTSQPNSTYRQTSCGQGSGFWSNMALCLLDPLMDVAIWLFDASKILFGWIINAENINFILGHPGLYEVWAFVRDILNIAFLLVLIFSAFCTIFQVDKFNSKKILLTLVIMALLVNFSYPITLVIIDASNVLMYSLVQQFLTNNVNDAYTTIAQNSGLSKILTVSYTSAGTLLVAIIFTFMFSITLMAIAILLWVRILALAILLVFSSVAFVGSIVPGLSGQAGKWWDQLFKYAFFGPISIFMLYVSIKLMTIISRPNIKSPGSVPQMPADPNFLANLAFSIIPIIVLWLGIGAMQSFGVSGSKEILSKAQNFMKAPAQGLGWAIKKGTKAGAKKFERDVLAPRGLSPRAFLKAWDANFETAEKEKIGKATGAWRDRLNRSVLFGGKQTNYAQLEKDRQVAERKKEYTDVSEDSKFINDNLANMMGKNSDYSRDSLQALIRVLYGNNDQDELMDFIRLNLDKKILPEGKTFRDYGFFHETKDMTDENGKLVYELDKDGKILQDENGKDIVKQEVVRSNVTVSDENVTGAVEKIMGSAGSDSKEINKLLLDLGNIAVAKGGIGFGSITYDEKKKEFARTNTKEGEQAYYNALKIMTMGEAQNIPKTMHRNHFTDQAGNLNQTGKELLRIYASPTAIKHIERHKPDFYKKVGGDPEISKQMYEYAKALKEGHAMSYNERTKKMEEIKADEHQATQAAAWIFALQRKSGVDETKAKESLTANGFKYEDIRPILDDGGFK